QFIAMTLELNRDAHLTAGIPPTHIAAAAAHVPRGWRRPDLLDHPLGLRTETEPPTPVSELVRIKHSQPLDRTAMPVGSQRHTRGLLGELRAPVRSGSHGVTI